MSKNRIARRLLFCYKISTIYASTCSTMHACMHAVSCMHQHWQNWQSCLPARCSLMAVVTIAYYYTVARRHDKVAAYIPPSPTDRPCRCSSAARAKTAPISVPNAYWSCAAFWARNTVAFSVGHHCPCSNPV
jgi:hypothetical protein